MTEAKWYFDFISPFAYLQLARFSTLPGNLEITAVPVVFGGLLTHWGQLGPAEIPPKRRFVYRFFQWNADRLGVPFAMPPRHPYNPLPSLSALCGRRSPDRSGSCGLRCNLWAGHSARLPQGGSGDCKGFGHFRP